MPPIKESVHDDGLAHYKRVRHYNRAAVDGILKKVGGELEIWIKNVEENTVVPDREIDIAIFPTSLQPPPPTIVPALQLPKTTKTKGSKTL
jgi:hypothetical protein